MIKYRLFYCLPRDPRQWILRGSIVLLLTICFLPSIFVKAEVVDQAMGQISAAAKIAEIETAAPVAPQDIVMEIIRRI